MLACHLKQPYRSVSIASASIKNASDIKKSLAYKKLDLKYIEPSAGKLKVFDIASKLLMAEREKCIAKLNDGSDNSHRLKLDVGFSYLKNHWDFNMNISNPSFNSSADASEQSATKLYSDTEMFQSETWKNMRESRFRTISAPKLVGKALKAGIYRDALGYRDYLHNTTGRSKRLSKQFRKIADDTGGIVNIPKVEVAGQFCGISEWKDIIGHAVPPNWTLHSPQISINTFSETPGLYTLALMDLDRPSLTFKSTQEWCHWLVTNIPITSNITIPGGTSPYLAPPTATTLEYESSKGESFHSKSPEILTELPGTTVFPYVPPHPANSNPRSIHRYVLAVLKQNGKVDVSSSSFAAQKSDASFDMWEKDYIGDREKELLVRERGAMSIQRMASDFGMSVEGFGFFTSGFNLHTPDIFTRLGIHEPVYGEFPNKPIAAAHKIKQSISHVKNASIGEKLVLSTLSLAQIKSINTGEQPQIPKYKLPTRSSLAAAAKLSTPTTGQSNSNVTDIKKAKGKKPQQNRKVKVVTSKMARMTALGSVAVVKNKTDDFASGTSGAVLKGAFERRNRYENI